MKQGRLRAMGENKSREEVIQVIVDENAEAACHDVMERFEEIARERGLDATGDGESRRIRFKREPWNEYEEVLEGLRQSSSCLFFLIHGHHASFSMLR